MVPSPRGKLRIDKIEHCWYLGERAQNESFTSLRNDIDIWRHKTLQWWQSGGLDDKLFYLYRVVFPCLSLCVKWNEIFRKQFLFFRNWFPAYQFLHQIIKNMFNVQHIDGKMEGWKYFVLYSLLLNDLLNSILICHCIPLFKTSLSFHISHPLVKKSGLYHMVIPKIALE